MAHEGIPSLIEVHDPCIRGYPYETMKLSDPIVSNDRDRPADSP